MKHFILVMLLWCFYSETSWSQSKPKEKKVEKAPSNKEMEDLMKEAKKAMDELDPEAKQFMDSMGIKKPSFKNVPKVSEGQMQKAWEEELRIVPILDKPRIESVSKAPLTPATVASYLSSINTKIFRALNGASQSKGDELYLILKTKFSSSSAKGNAAAGLWMVGKPELAIYLLGKTCQEDPTQTDNLSNYAAMLSMTGAEQLAIPILEYLNIKFPNNSTILNNLGQAWFGLGDLTKAERYLDMTIRLYAYHPQANLTKSLLEESKGNKEKAIDATIRSIKHGYTAEKEDRLRSLGRPVTGKDIVFPIKPKADPLNFGAFTDPGFPLTVSSAIKLELEWRDFTNSIEQQLTVLNRQLKMAEENMARMQQQRMEHDVTVVRNSMKNGVAAGTFISLPFFASKARLKLKELDRDDHFKVALKKNGEAFKVHVEDMYRIENEYNKEIDRLTEAESNQTGEGRSNKSFCPQKMEAANKFMAAYNPRLFEIRKEYFEIIRLRMDEEIHWYQYVQWPDQFEVTKISFKIQWLNMLKENSYKFITAYDCDQKKVQAKKGKLAEFDDVHCEYHSEMKLGIGTIKSDCSRMTTSMDLGVFKGSIKQDMDKDNFNDQFMSCTVEVGVSKSVGFSNGPLKAEASIGAGAGLEFDRSGVKDVFVKAGASVSAGTDMIEGGSMAGIGVNDLSVEVGVEGKISLVSGRSTVESKGILQDVFKK